MADVCSVWEGRLNDILTMLNKGKTYEAIGRYYGVSRERIRQIVNKYELIDKPPLHRRKRRSRLDFLGPKRRWLYRRLVQKGYGSRQALDATQKIHVPDCCPVFGFKLNFDAKKWDWRSASIDRIDSGRGYEIDNVQIISLRANVIKTDATPAELMRLAEYMAQVEAGKRPLPTFDWMSK